MRNGRYIPGERTRVIEAFERDIRNDPVRLELIRKLPADAVLGCWCAPFDCHGHVIVKIWEEMHAD
jgi:hypothetical protein